jgi:hypothetical protein
MSTGIELCGPKSLASQHATASALMVFGNAIVPPLTHGMDDACSKDPHTLPSQRWTATTGTE